MSKAARRKRIDELFQIVGLPSHAPNLPLKGYSKGMLQRIGLAQSLLNNPTLVVLDEPQSGLDPMGRKEIRDLILSLRDQGTTVFFSSHILSDAEMICDRVAIVNHGRLVAEGETQSLLSAKILEYEVVASGLSEQTVESARQRAKKVIIRDKDTLFVFTEEGDVRELLVKVTQENATLMSLTPRRETLEEYFIREVSKPKAA